MKRGPNTDIAVQLEFDFTSALSARRPRRRYLVDQVFGMGLCKDKLLYAAVLAQAINDLSDPDRRIRSSALFWLEDKRQAMDRISFQDCCNCLGYLPSEVLLSIKDGKNES